MNEEGNGYMHGLFNSQSNFQMDPERKQPLLCVICLSYDL